jgi:imidazolonepropionase-like amidohydrolase/predicted esterase
MSPAHRKLGVALLCSDERSARESVRKVAEAGMDHVKLCIMIRSYSDQPLKVFPLPVARAIVDEAHALGLKACAHAHWNADYRLALDAGVDNLMHSSFDPLEPEVVERVKDSGVSVCPTLWVFQSACLGAEERWDRAGGRQADVVPAVARSWRRFGEAYAASGDVMPPGIAGGVPKDLAKRHVRVAAANLKLLRDAGVPFAFGSDGPFGYSVLGRPVDELSALHQAGLEADECLRAATSGAAALLGCHDRGVIEPGRRADLLIVDGNPCDDITAIGSVEAVYRGGHEVSASAQRRKARTQRGLAVAAGLAKTVLEAMSRGFGELFSLSLLLLLMACTSSSTAVTAAPKHSAPPAELSPRTDPNAPSAGTSHPDGQHGAAPSSANPPPMSPAPPASEATLVELPLSKGLPAVVSVPQGATTPRPVIVVTHGAGGRATTHCRLWHAIVQNRGFLLCPRGYRMGLEGPPEEAAYFYAGHPSLGEEISRALEALRNRFGNRVDFDAPIFAGYSQGAGMGSMILPDHPARFARAVLVEGGFGQYQEWNVAASRRFKNQGAERVLLACGRPVCRDLAETTASYMRRGGLEARVIYAAGAGHNYGGPLFEQVRAAFAWVVADDPRW